jgi:hypothetical protein
MMLGLGARPEKAGARHDLLTRVPPRLDITDGEDVRVNPIAIPMRWSHGRRMISSRAPQKLP